MFARLLLRSLRLRLGRNVVAAASVWVGLSLVVALLVLRLEVGDRLNRELAAFGANIEVLPAAASIPVEVGGIELAPAPAAAYLNEDDLAGLTRTFWRNNILGFVPRLATKVGVAGREVPLLGVWFRREIPVEGGNPFITGARPTYGHWQVEGDWPADNGGLLAGRGLAEELGLGRGQTLELRGSGGARQFRVCGILSTGEGEDRALVASLSAVQAITGLKGSVTRIDVSALTTPENKLAERYSRDPASLTPTEYERWYCTPYPGSVARDVEKALPGSSARVVRRVAETQGAILTRIEGLVLVLSVVALLASGLAAAGVLGAAAIDRRPEVALLRALGAHRLDVLLLFLAETGVVGIGAGALAAGTGAALGVWLIDSVFGVAAEIHPAVLITGPLLGLLIAVLAGAGPIARAMRQDTALVLKGG